MNSDELCPGGTLHSQSLPETGSPAKIRPGSPCCRYLTRNPPGSATTQHQPGAGASSKLALWSTTTRSFARNWLGMAASAARRAATGSMSLPVMLRGSATYPRRTSQSTWLPGPIRSRRIGIEIVPGSGSPGCHQRISVTESPSATSILSPDSGDKCRMPFKTLCRWGCETPAIFARWRSVVRPMCT